jgi:hypothetical protein
MKFCIFSVFFSCCHIYSFTSASFVWTWGTYPLKGGHEIFLLCLFGQFPPGHGLPCFLPPVTQSSCRCPPIFLVKQSVVSLRTSSARVFLSFPTDLLSPKFPSRLCFGFYCRLFLPPAQPTITFEHVYTLPGDSLYTVYSASLCRILRTPFSCTGPNILRMIFLSRNRSFVRPAGKASVCQYHTKNKWVGWLCTRNIFHPLWKTGWKGVTKIFTTFCTNFPKY